MGWTPEELVIKMPEFFMKSGTLLVPAEVRWTHFRFLEFSALSMPNSEVISTSAQDSFSATSLSDSAAVLISSFLPVARIFSNISSVML